MPKKNANSPLSPNNLNDFFSSVFMQAPAFDENHSHTIPTPAVINSLFLTAVNTNEITSVAFSLLNSKSMGSDGIPSFIIKSNLPLLVNQLAYIINLSMLKIASNVMFLSIFPITMNCTCPIFISLLFVNC
jgi:hypothetical protein